MSFSKLEVFDPPVVGNSVISFPRLSFSFVQTWSAKLILLPLQQDLQLLQILNLQGSFHLLEIKNISRLPNLEKLNIWNCRHLAHVCETIRDLSRLVLVNMTGCLHLVNSNSWLHVDYYSKKLKASNLGEGSLQKTFFSLPRSLEQLLLKDCKHP